MANLWRTERPRFPQYQSDGHGRDFYIKYTNGGYWENQFVVSKKPDYERPRYKNFHSLYHMAAPFKYWGNGSGRENYILKCNGFHHDQKPLCSYQLTDFLRNNLNIRGIPENYKRKIYFSVSEARYNQRLKKLEKNLVKRLYTEPLKQKKKKMELMAEEENNDINNNNRISIYAKTSTNFKKKTILDKDNDANYYESINTDLDDNSNIGKHKMKVKNNLSLDSKNWRNKHRNETNLNYFNTLENKQYSNTFYGNFDHKKEITLGNKNYISPKNNLKFIDPRGKYNRNLKFKCPKFNDKILMKKIKIASI